uniref:WD_REPEATS_REGION domain-containing protein n=1 Tax=Rhabditophanes sp. KR3021 TaxID=114890 RepID=A0AC35TPN6_9BILA
MNGRLVEEREEPPMVDSDLVEHFMSSLPKKGALSGSRKSLDSTPGSSKRNVPAEYKPFIPEPYSDDILDYQPLCSFVAPSDKGTNKDPVYAVIFIENQLDQNPIFVVAMANKIIGYEIDPNTEENICEPLFVIKSCPDNESFYTLASTHLVDGSIPILISGGKGKVITVYSLHNAGVLHNMFGHSEAIQEIRVSPADPEIIATASSDESCRLWNIKHGIQIAIFGGPESHAYEIVSLDFSEDGRFIATAGRDYKICLWNLTKEDFDTNIFTLEKRLQACKRAQLTEIEANRMKIPIRITYPIGKNLITHDCDIDSVRIVGDYILSKDTQEKIVQWKFGDLNECLYGHSSIYYTESLVSIAKVYTIPVPVVSWFYKMDFNHDKTILALPHANGSIYLYDLAAECVDGMKVGPNNVIRPKFSKEFGIRGVAFSKRSRYLVGVGENGKVIVYTKNCKTESLH